MRNPSSDGSGLGGPCIRTHGFMKWGSRNQLVNRSIALSPVHLTLIRFPRPYYTDAFLLGVRWDSVG